MIGLRRSAAKEMHGPGGTSPGFGAARCSCCPYGYHIDQEFLCFIPATPRAASVDLQELRRRHRLKMRHRQEMESLLMQSVLPSGDFPDASTASSDVDGSLTEDENPEASVAANSILSELDETIAEALRSIDELMNSKKNRVASLMDDSSADTGSRSRAEPEVRGSVEVAVDGKKNRVDSQVEDLSVDTGSRSHAGPEVRGSVEVAGDGSLREGGGKEVGCRELEAERADDDDDVTRDDRFSSDQIRSNSEEVSSRNKTRDQDPRDAPETRDGSRTETRTVRIPVSVSTRYDSNSGFTNGNAVHDGTHPQRDVPHRTSNRSDKHPEELPSSADLAKALAVLLPFDGKTSVCESVSESLLRVKQYIVSSLRHMRNLEQQVKTIPVMQVRVSVLKEEKKLLRLQLLSLQSGLPSMSAGRQSYDDVTTPQPTPDVPSSTSYSSEYNRRSQGGFYTSAPESPAGLGRAERHHDKISTAMGNGVYSSWLHNDDRLHTKRESETEIEDESARKERRGNKHRPLQRATSLGNSLFTIREPVSAHQALTDNESRVVKMARRSLDRSVSYEPRMNITNRRISTSTQFLSPRSVDEAAYPSTHPRSAESQFDCSQTNLVQTRWNAKSLERIAAFRTCLGTSTSDPTPPKPFRDPVVIRKVCLANEGRVGTNGVVSSFKPQLAVRTNFNAAIQCELLTPKSANSATTTCWQCRCVTSQRNPTARERQVTDFESTRTAGDRSEKANDWTTQTSFKISNNGDYGHGVGSANSSQGNFDVVLKEDARDAESLTVARAHGGVQCDAGSVGTVMNSADESCELGIDGCSSAGRVVENASCVAGKVTFKLGSKDRGCMTEESSSRVSKSDVSCLTEENMFKKVTKEQSCWANIALSHSFTNDVGCLTEENMFTNNSKEQSCLTNISLSHCYTNDVSCFTEENMFRIDSKEQSCMTDVSLSRPSTTDSSSLTEENTFKPELTEQSCLTDESWSCSFTKEQSCMTDALTLLKTDMSSYTEDYLFKNDSKEQGCMTDAFKSDSKEQGCMTEVLKTDASSFTDEGVLRTDSREQGCVTDMFVNDSREQGYMTDVLTTDVGSYTEENVFVNDLKEQSCMTDVFKIDSKEQGCMTDVLTTDVGSYTAQNVFVNDLKEQSCMTDVLKSDSKEQGCMTDILTTDVGSYTEQSVFVNDLKEQSCMTDVLTTDASSFTEQSLLGSDSKEQGCMTEVLTTTDAGSYTEDYLFKTITHEQSCSTDVDAIPFTNDVTCLTEENILIDDDNKEQSCFTDFSSIQMRTAEASCQTEVNSIKGYSKEQSCMTDDLNQPTTLDASCSTQEELFKRDSTEQSCMTDLSLSHMFTNDSSCLSDESTQTEEASVCESTKTSNTTQDVACNTDAILLENDCQSISNVVMLTDNKSKSTTDPYKTTIPAFNTNSSAASSCLHSSPEINNNAAKPTECEDDDICSQDNKSSSEELGKTSREEKKTDEEPVLADTTRDTFNSNSVNPEIQPVGIDRKTAVNGMTSSALDCKADSDETIAGTEKITLSDELYSALKIYSTWLQDSTEVNSKQLNGSLRIIQQDWFSMSTQKMSSVDPVKQFLDAVTQISHDARKYVINMVDSNDNTALHYAVSHRNFPLIRYLLSTGTCDVNRRNRAGCTAVMLASLVPVETEKHREVLRKLVEASDVNMRATLTGQTALMLAASRDHRETVRMLLEAKADPNLQDLDGSTALMCASEHGYINTVKILLSHPACDPCIGDSEGSTALSVAMEAGHRDIGVLLYAHINFRQNSSLSARRRDKRGSTSSIKKI